MVGCSTKPSTENVHEAVDSWGVTSAVSTGHNVPVSYWPGGRRGSRGSSWGLWKPLVKRNLYGPLANYEKADAWGPTSPKPSSATPLMIVAIRLQRGAGGDGHTY